MKLAACYIVRDEAAALRKSIESLGGVYDSLLVVDTGSADDTAETARSLGAEVCHFAWCDDFAAARNFALAELRRSLPDADWVIFLDADEYFSTALTGSVRDVIERAAAAGATALLIMRDSIETTTGEVLSEEANLRVFALRPGRRYEGRIHEELLDDGEPIRGLCLIPREQLLLYHTGYSAHVNVMKAERNLHILKEELAKSEELTDPGKRQAAVGRLYMYLAEAYRGVGDMDAALHYARLDIAQGRRSVVFASRSYHLALGILNRELSETDRLRQYDLLESRLSLVRQAVQDFPELPELFAEYGSALLSVGELSGAEQAMTQALVVVQPADSIEPRQFSDRQRQQARLLLERIRQARQRKIFITAGLIFRNEASVLPGWMESAKKYADEIIAADTGSDDDGADIARKAGAKVLHLGTADEGLDFAAAKNAVLEAAAAQQDRVHWYVFLDADERFYHPERVRGLLQLLPAAVQGVQVPLHNIDKDRLGEEIDRVPVLRLWHARPGRRFVGRVHETVYDTRADGSMTAVPEQTLVPAMAVCHTGYSSSLVGAKARRNLDLLKADIKEYGEQPRHWRYLATTFYGLAEYELAARYADLAIRKGPTFVAGQREMYAVRQSALRLAGHPSSERLAAACSALKAFPEDEEFREEQAMLEAFLAFDRWYAALDESDARGERVRERWISLDEAGRRLLVRWSRERGRWDVQSMLADMDSAVGLPAVALVRLAAQGEREQVAAQLPQAFGQSLRMLFSSLYYQLPVSAVNREVWLAALAVLPDTMQQVLLRAAGSGQALTAAHFDAWQSGLLALAQNAAPDSPDWRNYARLALDFAPDWQMVERAADELQAQDAWEAAFELLEQVPVAEADGAFWYRVGVVLYHLREQGAAECFARAAKAGCTARNLSAYAAWSVEVRS